MKKRILIVALVLSLVCACFMIPADAKANVKRVWFEGEHVKLRAGANIDLLCDNKILSEENASAMDYKKDGIVLVQNTNMMDAANNTPATMYFELDSLQDIDSVYITWYVLHKDIIGLPHNNNLIIGYSADGESYVEIGAYNFEGETDPETSFQLETVIRLGQTVKAKYVSVSFEFGPSNDPAWYCPILEWVGFTEVGAGLEVDEVLGGGYDEVSEDNTPLDQIEPIVPIPEGAVALKHAKFNTSITTGSYTIITDPAAIHDFNVRYTSSALLRPTETEGEYAVVEVKWLNGDDTFLFADVQEGDIVLSIHGDDASDGTKANREALAALAAEDIVTFAGYNFEEKSFVTGAVVYFMNPNAGTNNGDASETPDDTSSDEVSDEASETPDESSKPADESSPADESDPADGSTPVVDNSEAGGGDEGGNTGLIIGIAIGVVAVAAIVVVVIIVIKKKK